MSVVTNYQRDAINYEKHIEFMFGEFFSFVRFISRLLLIHRWPIQQVKSNVCLFFISVNYWTIYLWTKTRNGTIVPTKYIKYFFFLYFNPIHLPPQKKIPYTITHTCFLFFCLRRQTNRLIISIQSEHTLITLNHWHINFQPIKTKSNEPEKFIKWTFEPNKIKSIETWYFLNETKIKHRKERQKRTTKRSLKIWY